MAPGHKRRKKRSAGRSWCQLSVYIEITNTHLMYWLSSCWLHVEWIFYLYLISLCPFFVSCLLGPSTLHVCTHGWTVACLCCWIILNKQSKPKYSLSLSQGACQLGTQWTLHVCFKQELSWNCTEGALMTAQAFYSKFKCVRSHAVCS